jgi:hypothetical protein
MKKSVAAVVFVVAAAIVGCSDQTAPARKPGEIALDGTTHTATSVHCGQDEWHLRIETKAGTAEARAYLQLDGETPEVDSVTIANPDGFNGRAGDGVGAVQATVAEGTYTITGTAEGFDRTKPAEPRSAKFRIQAPC